MNSKFYKCCAVPQCDSTSIKSPNKLFIYVPHSPKIRKKWLQLARRDPQLLSTTSRLYFCEDHFDVGFLCIFNSNMYKYLFITVAKRYGELYAI